MALSAAQGVIVGAVLILLVDLGCFCLGFVGLRADWAI